MKLTEAVQVLNDIVAKEGEDIVIEFLAYDQEANNIILEFSSNTKSNTAYKVMNIGDDVIAEFELAGYLNVSENMMANAVSKVFKSLKRQYDYLPDVEAWGGFSVPVDEYDDIYEVVIDAVADVIDIIEDTTKATPKSKKWNQTGKLQ
jgi:tRNA(Ile2) C34 agmatinyltransferase TiaS